MTEKNSRYIDPLTDYSVAFIDFGPHELACVSVIR
ncbi:hypothetical protein HDC92_002172 [Pedobacter sp. AK017]|nr:hypothetical protein [Pedobacter sp. AK017]